MPMTILRILTGDKRNEKKAGAGFIKALVLLFLLIGKPVTAVYAEETTPVPASSPDSANDASTVPPSQELAEVKHHYDSITWNDVLSKGPKQPSYSVLVEEKPREYSGMRPSSIKKQEGKTLVLVTPSSNQ